MTNWRYGLVSYKINNLKMLSIGELYFDKDGNCTLTTDEEFGSIFEQCLDDFSEYKNPEKKAARAIIKDLNRMKRAVKNYSVEPLKKSYKEEAIEGSMASLSKRDLVNLLRKINKVVTQTDGLPECHICCSNIVLEGHDINCKIGKIIELTRGLAKS